MADVFWVKASLYFGEQYLTDKNYTYLYHLLDFVTDLDPRFIVPYLFGGVVLPLEAKAVDEGIQLLEKGLSHIPDDWRIWFHLGFNYWYFLEDYETAAHYIEQAAVLPEAPPYLARFAASLYVKGGQKETAVAFLRQVYEQIGNENLRKEIKKKIEEILKEGND